MIALPAIIQRCRHCLPGIKPLLPPEGKLRSNTVWAGIRILLERRLLAFKPLPLEVRWAIKHRIAQSTCIIGEAFFPLRQCIHSFSPDAKGIQQDASGEF